MRNQVILDFCSSRAKIARPTIPEAILLFMRRWGLLFLAVTLALPLGCKPKSNQSQRAKTENLVAVSAPQAVHVDEDYQFKLKSPSDKWKILGEKEIRNIIPDAVAGGFRVGGTYGAVIIEPLGNDEVLPYANLLQQNLFSVLTNCESSPPTKLDFQGHSAYRFASSGQVEGTSVYYTHVVLSNKGFGYQLITWSTKGTAEKDAEEFISAFTLLDGEVHPRLVDTFTPDLDAVGYRVRDGEFSSSVYRFSAIAPDGWRLLVGGEIAQLNPDAIVGMASTDSTTYLAIIPEYVGSHGRESSIERMKSGHKESLRSEYGIDQQLEPVEITVLDRPVAFVGTRTSSSPQMEFYYGVDLLDDLSIQYIGWSLATSNEDSPEPSLKKLKTAFESLNLLDEELIEALRREELSQPDKQNSVGIDFSLSHGIYRDFAAGIIWKKPEGFWRIRTGDMAGDAELFSQELLSGVNLMLLAEHASGLSPEEFHTLAASNIIGDSETEAEPQSVRVDTNEGLLTIANINVDGMPLSYRIITTIRNETAFQVVFWGYQGQLQSAANVVAAALAGFSFPSSPMQPFTLHDSGFLSLRMGVRCYLKGEGWKSKDSTPSHLRSLAKMVTLKRLHQEVTIGAIGLPPDSPANTSFLDEMMTNVLQTNFSKFVGQSPEASIVQLGGLTGIKSKRRSWSDGNDSISFVVANRNNMIYFLITVDRSGSGAELFSSTLEGFRFVK